MRDIRLHIVIFSTYDTSIEKEGGAHMSEGYGGGYGGGFAFVVVLFILLIIVGSAYVGGGYGGGYY